jgi:CHAT domain-containing protein
MKILSVSVFCCTVFFLQAQVPDTARFEAYKEEIRLITVALEKNSGKPLPEETLKRMEIMEAYFQPVYEKTGQCQFYLAAIHAFRGSDYSLAGHITKGNDSYLKAIEILSTPMRVANDTSLADIHNLLSINYSFVGDFSNSDRCLDYAQANYQRLQMAQRVAMTDVNRSVGCTQRLKGEHARYYAERALRIMGGLKDNETLAFYKVSAQNALALAHRIIADSLMNTGNMDRAYQQYKKAAALHRTVSDSLLTMGTMEEVGYYVHKSWYHEGYNLVQLGDQERKNATALLEQLTESIRKYPNTGALAEDALPFALLGTAYSREGRFDMAHNSHNEAESRVRVSIDEKGAARIAGTGTELKYALANILLQRAMSLREEGIYKGDTVLLRRSVDWGEKALNQWEGIVLAYDSGESDQLAGVSYAACARWLASTAAVAFEKTRQTAFLSAALGYCEAMKAYNLRYMARQQIASQQFKGVQKEIYVTHKGLRERMRLAGSDMALKEKIKLENEVFIRKLSQSKDPDSLGYFVEVLDNRILSAPQLYRHAPPGKAVIQYLVSREALMIFIIKNGDCQIKKYPLPKDFEKQVEDYVRSMREQRVPNKPRYVNSAQLLYRTLFPPAVEEHLADVSGLIIVPDGILHAVQFTCLLTARTAVGDDYKRMPYLIRRFSVAYQYSLTCHHLVAQVTPEKNTDLSLGTFMARYGEESRNQPLSKMAAEAPLIQQKYFPSGQSFVYASATAHQITALSGLYDVLYFIMHGQAHERKDPLSYGLVCSDVVLRLSDMYDLSFRTQLAVFGSCNTAWGTNGQGEGIYSMARVCVVRGCRSVMATTNEVRGNEIAAPIIRQFFEEWRGGTSPKGKAQSLANAQLHYLHTCPAGDGFEHPALWGNFILIGED